MAQLLGKKDKPLAQEAGKQLVYVALFVSTFISLILVFFRKQILGLVSACYMGIFVYLLLFTVAADLVMIVPRIMKLSFTDYRYFKGIISVAVLILTSITCVCGFINARQIDHVSYEIQLENKKDISTARAFGDLSENSEYDEARNEQAKNEARIKELEELLENAVILDESTIDTSVISLGSTVKLLNKTVNAEFTYALVGSNEANPAEGKISDQSPIGAALINKKAGDEITVEVPNGTLVMKVLEVTRK